MNERILELAKLAEKYADEETNAFTDDSGQWKVIWNETYDKKFAVLIVNDVLNIVSISGEQCNCSTLFRNISEHFGVTQ